MAVHEGHQRAIAMAESDVRRALDGGVVQLVGTVIVPLGIVPRGVSMARGGCRGNFRQPRIVGENAICGTDDVDESI